MGTNLNLVDEFQQRFGQKVAYERAQQFMFAYISQMRRVLPPAAARGLEVAKKIREGTVTSREREQAIKEIWNYVDAIDPHNRELPESSITRIITWLLRDDLGAGEEYVSEVLHWFLHFANEFEDHSDIAEMLLRKIFSSAQGN
jgi:hypothetical protein